MVRCKQDNLWGRDEAANRDLGRCGFSGCLLLVALYLRKLSRTIDPEPSGTSRCGARVHQPSCRFSAAQISSALLVGSSDQRGDIRRHWAGVGSTPPQVCQLGALISADAVVHLKA